MGAQEILLFLNCRQLVYCVNCFGILSVKQFIKSLTHCFMASSGYHTSGDRLRALIITGKPENPSNGFCPFLIQSSPGAATKTRQSLVGMYRH